MQGAARKKKVAKPAGFKGQIFMLGALIMGAVFLPTTAMLAVGMMPTIVAAFTDMGRRRTKAVTVGAMNLAGCMPFMLQLWSQGHSFEESVKIFTDPMAVVVMYSAAGIGYVLDWAIAGVVATLLYQQGLVRQKSIRARQKELVERWGPEVTGQLPLDEQGFPLERPKT